MRLLLLIALSLSVAINSTQAVADPIDDSIDDLATANKHCAKLSEANKLGKKADVADFFLCPAEELEKFQLYGLEACRRVWSGKGSSLDTLKCAVEREHNGLELHYEFTCKAGLFNKTETYQVYGNWKTSKGEALDNMSPWYFIPIEASEDRERTLVIHETKLSAAMVTKTRRFSSSKGYYWDEEKFYCQREHFDH